MRKLAMGLGFVAVVWGSVGSSVEAAPMKTRDTYGLVTGVADKSLAIKWPTPKGWSPFPLTLRVYDAHARFADTVYAEVKGGGSAADLAPGALVSIWRPGTEQGSLASVVVIYKPAKASRYTPHVLRACKSLMVDSRPRDLRKVKGNVQTGKVKSINGAKVILASDQGEVTFSTSDKTAFFTVSDKTKKDIVKKRWVAFVMEIAITGACHGRAVVLTSKPLSVRPAKYTFPICLDCALAGLCAKHKGVVKECADCKAKGLCRKHDKEVWECLDCSNGFCKKHKAECAGCQRCTEGWEASTDSRHHPLDVSRTPLCRAHVRSLWRCKACRKKAPRCGLHKGMR